MKFVPYVVNVCREPGMDFQENPLEMSREDSYWCSCKVPVIIDLSQ